MRNLNSPFCFGANSIQQPTAKIKIAHLLAGFCLWLAVYALYLQTFLLFKPHPSAYWIFPIPNTLGFGRNFTSELFLLWHSHRLEIIISLAGLLWLPTCLLFMAWRARKNPIAWLQRWSVLFALMVVCLIALFLIAHSISLILPVPRFYL